MEGGGNTFSGVFTQNITYNPIVCLQSRSTSEETILDDAELIELFAVSATNEGTDTANEDNNNEEVNSEQAGTNEEDLLATTGSKFMILYLITSLVIFIVLKFNIKKCN